MLQLSTNQMSVKIFLFERMMLMRKWFKAFVSMLLVFALAFTFSPVTASAGYIKVTHANTGYVKCIYYRGGPAKKASFSVTSAIIQKNYGGYDVYDVTIKINKPYFTQKDTIGIYNDLTRKGSKTLLDYVPIFTNKNGGTLRGLKRKLVSTDYSKPYRSYAKIGKKKIWINHRKYNRYNYRIYVPANQEGVYVGVAGLGYGQLTTVTYKRYLDGKITYGGAGFGSTKSGFACISRIS